MNVERVVEQVMESLGSADCRDGYWDKDSIRRAIQEALSATDEETHKLDSIPWAFPGHIQWAPSSATIQGCKAWMVVAREDENLGSAINKFWESIRKDSPLLVEMQLVHSEAALLLYTFAKSAAPVEGDEVEVEVDGRVLARTIASNLPEEIHETEGAVTFALAKMGNIITGRFKPRYNTQVSDFIELSQEVAALRAQKKMEREQLEAKERFLTEQSAGAKKAEQEAKAAELARLIEVGKKCEANHKKSERKGRK